jgi:hypothetical protein
MARARMIKPEFASDEKLSMISRDARLTYVLLWTCCDDYGVTKAHPSWLKSQVFPYDDIDLRTFTGWLGELERLERIRPFTAKSEKYYYLPTFLKHQKVDHPSKTRNPEPPREFLATLSRESLDETETETETESTMSDSRSDPSDVHQHKLAAFDQFYCSYPKHEGKQKALQAWERLKPDKDMAETILRAIERQKAHKARLKEKGEFAPEWPMPATWLTGRRWEDEVSSDEQSTEDPIERAKRRMGL